MSRGVRVTSVLVGFLFVMVPGLLVLAPMLVPHVLWVTALVGVLLILGPRLRHRGRGRRDAIPRPGAVVVDLAAYREARHGPVASRRAA